MFIGRMIIVVLLFIILGLCAFLGKDMLEKKKLRDNREQAATSAESESTADTAGTESAAETETQAHLLISQTVRICRIKWQSTSRQNRSL